MRPLFLLLLGTALLLAAPLPAAFAAPGDAEQPNIVVITTDDQPRSSFTRKIMPRTFKLLVDEGTNFSDAVTVVPLCCPSRATLITGQYPHNHGILANQDGYGSLIKPRSVLPVWLRRAGYRTAHIGKWLHGYEEVEGTRPAPGWSRWLTQISPRRYNDYELSDEGRRVRYGTRPGDHLSRVLNRAAQSFVRGNVDGRRPLYLQLDHFAPHRGAGVRSNKACIGSAFPEVGDIGTSPIPGAPRTPAFNELDTTDKPYWERDHPLLDERQVRSLDRRYRCVAESLASVDRGVAALVRAFRRSGELRNTAFLFMTDNGYLFGEHRLKAGKTRALEPAIRVPMALRLPRDAQQQPVSDLPVATLDVVPTVLELAGAEPCSGGSCRILDGRSLLPLAEGRTSGFAGRSILIEVAEPATPVPIGRSCAYTAVRAGGSIYIDHSLPPNRETGACEPGSVIEQYDLRADPFQLENLAESRDPAAAGARTVLAERLRELEDCAGLEGRDPATPGGYCD